MVSHHHPTKINFYQEVSQTSDKKDFLSSGVSSPPNNEIISFKFTILRVRLKEHGENYTSDNQLNHTFKLHLILYYTSTSEYT